jgi:diguanylate cyclase (GGDEF)-like protein/PAS domain S-box-containing protein
MKQINKNISHTTTTIAVVLATIVTITIPTGYFALQYQNVMGKLDAEVEINSQQVAKLIGNNPELWRYESLRLDELLSRRPVAGSPEIRRIFDLSKVKIATNGDPLPPPTVSHIDDITDAGMNVAQLEIVTTLQPVILRTALVSLWAFLFGIALYAAIRYLPMKALLDAEKSLKEANEFLSKIMENSTNGILVLTPETRVVMANQHMQEISGFDDAEFSGLVSFLDIIPVDEREHVAAQLQLLTDRSTASLIFETSLVCQSGRIRFLSCGAAPIITENSVSALVLSIDDITVRKESEARIRKMAYFDSLTNLPNRALFSNELEHAIAYAKRYGTSFGLMLIDVDNFKRINDTLGHSYGDQLLQKVAERLVDSVRKSDYLSRPASEGNNEVVARLGGDEFTVLLTCFNHEEDAAKVAARIIEKTALPYQIEGQEVFVTLSIGIATYPGDGTSQDILFRNADTAMYHAKFLGKNTFQFYRSAMNEAAMQRLTLENHLFKALERKEFHLNYQPQVNIQKGTIVGVEALLRWSHPELGMVSPLEFISIAEENGLIIPITEWVLEEACRQNKAWQDQGLLPRVRVAVNISTQVLKQRDLPSMIADVLEKSGLDPAYLEVEITESVMLHNVEGTIKLLKTIRDMGVSISIDDFGTGYSSFSYLKQLPVHAIKIDRSFVKDLPGNPEDIAIVKAIIATSHSLSLNVIAEGVETPEQLEFLGRHACDEFQGYLFSKPLSADDCARTMRSMNSAPLAA